jgi:hypothetical protein
MRIGPMLAGAIAKYRATARRANPAGQCTLIDISG